MNRRRSWARHRARRRSRENNNRAGYNINTVVVAGNGHCRINRVWHRYITVNVWTALDIFKLGADQALSNGLLIPLKLLVVQENEDRRYRRRYQAQNDNSYYNLNKGCTS
jgi:hypothetical protein